ncbi:MAG: flagellar hook-length control protein FliK [Variovorax sp.]|nr:flagellar hook-length control protein FliK [Variovorax sp.]
MPTPISPSLNLPGLQGAATGARGRTADASEGRSFGAALERSRSAAGAKDSAETAAAPETVATRKPGRAGEKKSELSAADVMALLAPLPASMVPAAAQDKLTAGQASTAAAAAAGVAANAASATALPTDATALADGAQPSTADAAVAKDAPAPEAPPQGTHPGARVADAGADADLPAAAAAATTAAAPLPDAATEAAALVPAPALATARPADAKASVPLKAGSTAAPSAAAATSTDPAPAAPGDGAAAVTAKIDAPAAQPDTASAEPADAPEAPSMPALQAAQSAGADRAAASAKPSTPTLTVAPQVGSSEWGPAIGHQMIRMNASGHQVAELNLNPAGLGPLKVTLTMGDNQAQAMFVSAHEAVRKAVEAALPQLRTTLAEQGITLGQASVGAETRQPNSGGAFADQNPSRPQGRPDDAATAHADNAAVQAAPVPAAAASRRASAGLDTFA